jgi:hypothetical protein
MFLVLGTCVVELSMSSYKWDLSESNTSLCVSVVFVSWRVRGRALPKQLNLDCGREPAVVQAYGCNVFILHVGLNDCVQTLICGAETFSEPCAGVPVMTTLVLFA